MSGPRTSDWRWGLIAALIGFGYLIYVYWQTREPIYLLISLGYLAALAIVIRTARM